MTIRDKCEFCLGAKGGVRGNENVFAGVIVCDYCTVLVLKIKENSGEAVPLGEVAQKVVDEVEAKRRCRDGGEWCKDGLCVTECHLMEKRT